MHGFEFTGRNVVSFSSVLLTSDHCIKFLCSSSWYKPGFMNWVSSFYTGLQREQSKLLSCWNDADTALNYSDLAERVAKRPLDAEQIFFMHPRHELSDKYPHLTLPWRFLLTDGHWSQFISCASSGIQSNTAGHWGLGTVKQATWGSNHTFHSQDCNWFMSNADDDRKVQHS